MKLIATGAALTAVLLGFSLAPVRAADPTGTWLTENNEATVRISNCGPDICGTIVALKEPNDPATGRPKTDKNNPDAGKRSRPVIGITIILGMKPNGADKWSGQIYNAEDGKIYSGNLMIQSARSLKLEGCVFGGLICKGQIWNRSG